MTSYRTLRIGVVAALLVVLLAVAGVPALSQPVHPSFPRAVHVAGFGEQLWNVLVSLWPRAWQKEGTSIDPNGGTGGQGSTVKPNSSQVTPDEGTSIDPDGK
jgi:hypothetical protein